MLPSGIVALTGLLVIGVGLTPAYALPAVPNPAAPAVPAPAVPAPGVPVPGAPTAPPAPAPATTPADAATALQQVQQDAEALTEQWHAAQDEVTARKAAIGPLRAAVAPAKAAVAVAQADEEKFRVQVDAVAMAAFETGNLDQFNALLASGNPQDFLDQMSTLETVTADQRATLDQLQVVIDRAARAQADADAAVGRAQVAADDAAKAEQDLGVRKRAADARIDQAQQLLAQLDPQQRRSRLGPDISAPIGPIIGNGLGVQALRAAQIQLGKPYRYGAEGPASFDCSGLTMWAFQRAGITLPRSSRIQSTIGRPVSWDEMQPGDLVFYYTPVSHVGIYAGGGKMINAPQTGDVVRYSKVSSRAFVGARRL